MWKLYFENLKINYLLIDIRNNYDVDASFDNKDLNMYQEYYEKANKYINIKRRIQNINEFLSSNITTESCQEILKKIEDVIYERREI